MQDAGATRPFNGRLERWSYTPINDTQMVANLIRSTLGLNRPSETQASALCKVTFAPASPAKRRAIPEHALSEEMFCGVRDNAQTEFGYATMLRPNLATSAPP